MPKQHHVFLSYSRVDNEMMQRVKDSLRQVGLKVWTDEGIVPGTPSWKEAIEDAIRETEILVVLMSPDSNKSVWVQREIDYADVQDVQIIPILIRDEPKDSVPFALAGSQFIDLRSDYDTGIALLVSRCYDYMQQTNGVTVEHKVMKPPKEKRTPPPRNNRFLFIGSGIGIVVLLIIALLFGTGVLPPDTSTETPTPTQTPSNTPTSRPTTAIAVVAPTETPTLTSTRPPTNTPSPTETRTPTITHTPSPSPTPSGALQLHYNANSLVVYNRSDDVATISGLEFVLITEEGNDLYNFASSRWGTSLTFLFPEQCVQVWRNDISFLPDSTTPATICQSRISYRSTINEFWIADWDDAYFEVRHVELLLTTCPATQSGSAALIDCYIDIP